MFSVVGVKANITLRKKYSALYEKNPKVKKSVIETLAKFNYTTSVCNFQSMKTPVELNSYENSFVLPPGLLYHLVRHDYGRLANEAFTSNPLVSLKQ